MTKRQDGEKTKERILKVAMALFAEKGFRDTTIADIVKGCGNVNAALVNYYFTDKKSLYQYGFRLIYQQTLEAFPLTAPPDASPEERLKAVIFASLSRLADKNNLVNAIIHQEISSPTGFLQELLEEQAGEMINLLSSCIRACLGPSVPEREKDLLAYSVLGMLLVPIRKILTWANFEMTPFTLAERQEHVWAVTAAALRDLKARWPQRD